MRRLQVPLSSILGNLDHLTTPVPEAQRCRIESDRDAKAPFFTLKFHIKGTQFPYFHIFHYFRGLQLYDYEGRF